MRTFLSSFGVGVTNAKILPTSLTAQSIQQWNGLRTDLGAVLLNAVMISQTENQVSGLLQKHSFSLQAAAPEYYRRPTVNGKRYFAPHPVRHHTEHNYLRGILDVGGLLAVLEDVC